MIRLNISVVLSVLFCVNFVNSFENSDEVLEMYKKRLQYRSRMVEDKEEFYLEYITKPKHDVCNKPREVRSAICKSVIRRLRTREGNSYNNLYMNYLAFTTGEPCRNVKVWINVEELLANQQVLNCFGSSLIMSPGSSIEMVYFYRKIVIHPWDRKHFLVFEYNEDENYYMLLTIYHMQFGILDGVGVSRLLFMTLVPQSWRDVRNLFSILSPIHSKLSEYSTNENNMVNSKRISTLWKICYVAFHAETLKKHFNSKYNDFYRPRSYELVATLRDPINSLHISVSVRAYSCKRAVVKDDILRKYYIAAGPGDHSAILLEEVESSNSISSNYGIIDFVEYLTNDYLKLYFEHSY